MANFCIELLYEGIDLEDEDTLSKLAEVEVDGAGPHDDQLVQITASIPADNAIRAATQLVNRMREFLPSATPVMADRDLVNVSDIAERISVSREAVRHWSNGLRREGNFPPPIDSPGGSKVWQWGAIHAWLRLNLSIWDGLIYPNHQELGCIDNYLAHVRDNAAGRVAINSRSWVAVKNVPARRSTLVTGRLVAQSTNARAWTKTAV